MQTLAHLYLGSLLVNEQRGLEVFPLQSLDQKGLVLSLLVFASQQIHFLEHLSALFLIHAVVEAAFELLNLA